MRLFASQSASDETAAFDGLGIRMRLTFTCLEMIVPGSTYSHYINEEETETERLKSNLDLVWFSQKPVDP